jgi:uncharacterized protein (DUF362 family)/Pyruvate/2-oxoacid:ferredoxin oxidoreductase delta subunit
MPAKVAIVRCADYDRIRVKQAVAASFSFIGDLKNFIKPGARVLIKINHLGQHPVESAVNTHPAVIAAVVELVREHTPHVTVTDGLDAAGINGFRISGTLRMCEELHVDLQNLKGGVYRDVGRADFETVPSIPIAKAALDADVVITVTKLKTHMLCLMTNAVKNNYGLIPQRLRANFHRQFVDPDVFSNLVVDIFAARKPDLAIVDGIIALEGLGPSRGGTPKHLGLVMAGADCVAVDAVAAAVMGLEPFAVASTRHAARRRLGEGDLARIEVLGETIESARSPFKLPANRMLIMSVIDRMPRPIFRAFAWLVRSTSEMPRIDRARCIGCGLCVKHCPQVAIALSSGKARIDYSKCIACFCCQEFCESDAVAVRLPALGRVIARTGKCFRVAGRAIHRITGRKR